MPELRWTLLLLGALFIAVLAWSERRKARQSMRSGHEAGISEGPGPRASRDLREPTIREPTLRETALTLPEVRARDPSPPQDLPVVHVEDESLVGLRLEGRRVEPEIVGEGAPAARELGADPDPVGLGGGEWETISTPDPSVSELPVLEAAQTLQSSNDAHAEDVEPLSEPAEPFRQPVERLSEPVEPFRHPVEPAAEAGQPVAPEAAMPAPETGMPTGAGVPGASEAAEPPASAASVSAAPEAGAPGAGAGPTEPGRLGAPVVDWPPEQERRIIALRLVSVSPERLSGRAIRTALAAEGFVHGKFSIFHKADAHNRAVLSAASLSKPGIFDLDTIDSQRFSGLNLFTVLSTHQSAREPFELLLACARNLNERLEGGLQDDRGGPLTPSRIAALRESLAAPSPSS